MRKVPVPFVMALALAAAPAPARADGEAPLVRVGSKEDTEGQILGHMLVHLAQAAGARSTRSHLHGKLVWEALSRGEIDVYPEYTGTLAQEIFAGSGLKGEAALRQTLAPLGIRMSRPLGFNNTYALGLREEVAERLGVRTISDLRGHPDLRLGLSNEFMGRADGWPNLRAHYRLPQRDVRGMDHSLAYQALRAGDIQVTDVYLTDAHIRSENLRVLADDLACFPEYQAVLLYRADLADRAPDVLASLLRLEGRISQEAMIEMNTRAQVDKKSEERVAVDFVNPTFGLRAEVQEESVAGLLARRTAQHLFLVAVSLLAGIAVAVPLGIVAARRPQLGQALLAAAGVFQTIPSLALLAFMISLVAAAVALLPQLERLGVRGIGPVPAIVALFFYSLLPMMRNTYTALREVPPQLRESAEALGLPPVARLRLIELPLAARTIFAGIKTAAVISVGYATLGAFIGAGGYGEAILTGITRHDQSMVIWQGAVPAAVMAFVVQGLFELVERFCVPRGLRLRASS